MKPKAQLIAFAGAGSLFEAMYRERREWNDWSDDDAYNEE